MERFRRKKMEALNLDELNNGLPTLSVNFGRFLVEAAHVALERWRHVCGVQAIIVCENSLRENSQHGYIKLIWTAVSDEARAPSWSDDHELAEFGASCIAILYGLKITGCASVLRACKGTGIDFWLGDKDNSKPNSFAEKARLEISGILNGDVGAVKRRLKKKAGQTQRSADTDMPAIAIVVEFSGPHIGLWKS